MFTVSSTLMWAVLTGQTDWVCHIGTLNAVHRGGCLELYYCNMVEWFWCDSNLISTTNWIPSVLWHCWFGHLACKNRPRMTCYVSSGTLNPTHSLTHLNFKACTVMTPKYQITSTHARSQPSTGLTLEHTLLCRGPIRKQHEFLTLTDISAASNSCSQRLSLIKCHQHII